MEYPSTPQFIVAVVIGTVAALAVFRHADIHGNRHATAWGIAAFFAAVVVVPLYFLRHRMRTRRR